MRADNTTTNEAESDRTRQKVFVVVGIIAALLLAAVLYLMMRPQSQVATAPVLEGAIRPNTPEYEQQAKGVILDSVEADESPRALGDIVMTLRGTVRNFSERTIDGLEVRAMVVDSSKNPVKQRTVIIIPTRQAQLEPNKTMPIQVVLEGISQSADRANIDMQITGVRFR